jgi:hypothetical protein
MHRPTRLIACAWLLIAAASAVQAQVIDRVLARVDTSVITLSDVRAAQVLELVRTSDAADPVAAALTQLIDRELMIAEATKYSVPSPPAGAVDAQMAVIRARFATDAGFQAALEATAMTVGRLRDIVRDNLRVEAYVNQLFAAPAQPTDEEVARYYEQHRAAFVSDGRQLSLEEARGAATQLATAARRDVLIADWLTRLRSRATIVQVYPSPR